MDCWTLFALAVGLNVAEWAKVVLEGNELGLVNMELQLSALQQ